MTLENADFVYPHLRHFRRQTLEVFALLDVRMSIGRGREGAAASDDSAPDLRLLSWTAEYAPRPRNPSPVAPC